MPEETYNTAERIAGILSAIGAVGQGHLERRQSRMDEEALKKEAAQRRKEEIQLLFAKAAIPSVIGPSESLELPGPQPAGVMPSGRRGQDWDESVRPEAPTNEQRDPWMADWDNLPPPAAPSDWDESVRPDAPTDSGNVPRPPQQQQGMPTRLYGPPRELTYDEQIAMLAAKMAEKEQYERLAATKAADRQWLLDESVMKDRTADNENAKNQWMAQDQRAKDQLAHETKKLAQELLENERNRNNDVKVAGVRLQAAHQRDEQRDIEKLVEGMRKDMVKLGQLRQELTYKTAAKANKLANIKGSVVPVVNAYVLRKNAAGEGVTADEIKQVFRKEILKSYKSVRETPETLTEVNTLATQMYVNWAAEYTDPDEE